MKKNNLNQNNSNFLEYLVYEKNILSPKRAAVTVGIILIVIILMFNFIKVKFQDFDYYEGNDFTPEIMREVLIANGYDFEYVDKLDEEYLSTAFNEIYLKIKGQVAGDSKNPEFEESDAYNLRQEYYLLASKGNFKSIVDDFNNKKGEYYFSKFYNKELITIYNDAYYLNMIINNNQITNDRITETLKNIKDPQMLLYGTLFSPEEPRREVFEDKLSLSPIITTSSNIRVNTTTSGYIASAKTSTSMKNDERFTEVANFIGDSSSTIYKINFTVYDTELNAYLYKNLNQQKTYLYGIYAPKGSDDSNFLTVQELMKYSSNSEYNTKHAEENNTAETNANDNIESTNNDYINTDNNEENISDINNDNTLDSHNDLNQENTE